MKDKIIIICGSTCSGKSSLAIELSKRLNSAVISADSMCVYQDFDIGTAKPSKEERAIVPHYLIDVVKPTVNYSIADYKENAEQVIQTLLQKDMPPIICGGTGFYINSLIYDLSYGGGGENTQIRNKLNDEYKQFGIDYLWNKLFEVDSVSCKSIEKNDVKRVIRALEIFYNTGIPKSEIKDDFKPKRPYVAFCIDYPREELYKRIELRVDEMIKNGLVEETKKLVDDGLSLENNAMQGIGYKEIYAYLKGEITLNEAIDLIKINTRHYAKRQITFFKKLPGLIHLDSKLSTEQMIEIILSEYKKLPT